MTAVLLDANVLIALAWPAHEAHPRVQQWFARNSKQVGLAVRSPRQHSSEFCPTLRFPLTRSLRRKH